MRWCPVMQSVPSSTRWWGRCSITRSHREMRISSANSIFTEIEWYTTNIILHLTTNHYNNRQWFAKCFTWHSLLYWNNKKCCNLLEEKRLNTISWQPYEVQPTVLKCLHKGQTISNLFFASIPFNQAISYSNAFCSVPWYNSLHSS